MDKNHQTALPEITLRHFTLKDGEHFYEMVNDPAIKEFIEELDAPKDEVLYKFEGLNEEIYFHQYWGIFKPDDTLIGFVTLKKNKSIYNALLAKSHPIEESDELDFPTDEELKEKKWLSIVNAPYAIEVVIHSEHRKKGFARAAINKVIDYAGSSGLKKVYFEIHEKNEQSRKMIEPLNCASLIPAKDHYGHEIFEYTLVGNTLTTAEIVNELSVLKSDEDRGAFNFWREMTGSFPELIFHREILTQLYHAITTKEGIIRPSKDIKGCRYVVELFEKLVYISLQPREEQLTIIWSIAHEYGHMCQDEPTEMECKNYTREKYLREANAWDIAEEWLKDRPLYIYNWPSFIKFRNSRLEKYLPPNSSSF